MKTDVASLAPPCLGLSEAERTRKVKDYARQLARIEAALERIESGRYGICISCEGRIALTRLEADPTEAVCESCDEGKDA